MGFTSLAFLVFFPIVLLIYMLLPGKFRAAWLLAASYVFCASFGARYLVVLIASTAVTYIGGIAISHRRSDGAGRIILGVAVAFHVLFLCFFKYNTLSILLPVGISFYTFQSIGYLADVYGGKESAEKNIVSFALFQAFFPKLVQGPIERGGNLLAQIRDLPKRQVGNVENIRRGGLLLLWGLFEKLFIADRIAIPVDAVYSQFGAFGGVEIALSTLLYAFQIYADFAGYTDMARGAAQMLGFDLLPNFFRPYFADSVQDFWRRWHMSLSSWLRDYIYIPLGGSRKGSLRRAANIMITFLISGIWHGTGFHFLLWGGLHGAAQIFDIKKWKLPRWAKRVIVFIFVDLTWMVFRANSLGDIRGMLYIVATNFRLVDFRGMELTAFEWVLLAVGIFVLMLKDTLNERGVALRTCILSRPWPVRVLVYATLISAVVILGVYGADYDTSGFLYTNF